MATDATFSVVPTGITGLSSANVPTTPVGSDTLGNLNTTIPDSVSSMAALGALNASISLDIHGQQSVGFQLAAGTFIGTLTPQCSLDSGNTWFGCSFYNNSIPSVVSSVTFTSANTLSAYTILPIGGSSNVRVLVTGYTSGTANGLLRASQVAMITPADNLVSTGTLTGTGQSVNLTLQGTASVNIDVSGSGFVGTIVVYESSPSAQRNLGVFALNASSIAMSITANGNYRVVGVPTSGTITVAFSSYTSGSATINIYGSTAPYIVQPYSANASNVLVTSYLNDGVGNAVTSTTINSKQRLDVGTASEGLDGNAAPFWAIATGGKDGSGNLQTLLTDTSGNLAVLNKDGSGNSINSQSNALNVNTKTALVYSAPITASVGTTSTLILAANSARLGLYLSNTSLQQISLGFNGNAAAYQYGITLFPGEKFWMDEYSFSTGAIYAITTGAATYIGVQEIT